MQSENEHEVAVNSINLALQYKDKGLPGRSFAHFSVALKLKPEWKTRYQIQILNVLCDFTLQLEIEGRYTDLFNIYELALEILPRNESVLTLLGSHLCRLGYAKEARQYLKSALNINPNYLPAVRNIQNASNKMVEKWHFKMLNDRNRNSAFKKAIQKLKTENVLDIGTGTGLLSLYAVQRAQKVYACEYSETMFSIANNVIENNRLKNKIKLIKKLSNDIKIPNDIPSRCSLLVSEIFDGGLLGEGILETMIHAIENLATNNFNVIPLYAKIYAAPIQCLTIAQTYTNVPKKRRKVDTVVDVSLLPYKHTTKGPYDLEYLKNMNFDLLGEPVEIFEIKFDNLKNMKEHFSGSKNKNVEFVCSNGFLDAFIVYFDLFLDEEIKISTSPFCNEYTCWGQAIFPLYSSYCANTSILTNISCTSGKLTIEIKNDNNLIDVNQSVIRYLNSSSLINFIHNSVQIDKENILDLSPFPYGGVILSKKSKIFCFNNSADLIEDSLKRLTGSDKFMCQKWENFKNIVDTKFDVIIVDLIDTCGELCETSFSQFLCARKLLKPDGFVIPNTLIFWCQLIYSEQLRNEHEVFDENLDIGNYKIAEFINEYKTSTHIELNLSNLNYTQYSERTSIGFLDLKTYNEDNPDSFSGYLQVTKTGKFNAILHGFNYGTKDHLYDSFNEDSHVYKVAEILPIDQNVKKDEIITVCCLHQKGLTKYSIML